jgi:hypothetical protein
MTGIRPLEPGDLSEVASLYERVMRSGTRTPPRALEDFFRRTLLEQPWVDPEIPSLVYGDADGRLLGFLGSHPRRMRLGDRSIRAACSGQLVSDPDARKPGIGALLLRTYLHGPQELTFTDGATSPVSAIWERLGGRTAGLASLGWTAIFRPWQLAAELASRRRGERPGLERAASWLETTTGALTRRTLAPDRPRTSDHDLTPADLLEAIGHRRPKLRPDYDEAFLPWLFDEMARVGERGKLRRRLVRDSDGDLVGWFVYYLRPGGISQVQQVGAIGDSEPVLGHLLWDAAEQGAAALQGRLEPNLVAPLSEQRCLLRRSEWALVHSENDEPLAALGFGDALLTRMEGEWWMAPHLIPA